jgi:hypothetical protein
VFDEEMAGSAGPYATYSEALRKGTGALLAFAADPATCRCETGEDESQNPVVAGLPVPPVAEASKLLADAAKALDCSAPLFEF